MVAWAAGTSGTALTAWRPRAASTRSFHWGAQLQGGFGQVAAGDGLGQEAHHAVGVVAVDPVGQGGDLPQKFLGVGQLVRIIGVEGRRGAQGRGTLQAARASSPCSSLGLTGPAKRSNWAWT